ncbi:MAG TPA: hypothetical protein VN363_02655 [Anaerolineales bacterium]|nr:hypothetical protein [Anaerolineales bacterium]
MKKIGFFIALVLSVLLVVAACGPSDNAVEIAQAQNVIEAARAAQDASRAAQIASQGLSDMGRGQTLILVLMTLMVVLLIGMAAYIVIQRLIWKHSQVQPRNTGRWMSGPNAHWKRVEGSDPYQQLLLQQQMLLTQFLQQSQVESEEDDRPQLPTEWWG